MCSHPCAESGDRKGAEHQPQQQSWFPEAPLNWINEMTQNSGTSFKNPQEPSLKLQFCYTHFHINSKPGAARVQAALKGHFPLGDFTFSPPVRVPNKPFREAASDAVNIQHPKPQLEPRAPQ